MAGSLVRVDLGSPSDRCAVIMRARLPLTLERWRRRCVANAVDGVPAHATLLYPFIAPERLDETVRRMLANVAARHAPIRHAHVGPATWPGVVYLALDPVHPAAELQADLADAFPEFPIYGPGFDQDFVPHVTIAEGGQCVPLDDPAWRSAPQRTVVSALEVIARPVDGRWRTVWRIGLGGRDRSVAIAARR